MYVNMTMRIKLNERELREIKEHNLETDEQIIEYFQKTNLLENTDELNIKVVSIERD